MSASWSQGGQSAARPSQRSANPPPVCFNCGTEGHFVVDCPESQQRQAPTAFPHPTNGYQPYPTPQPSWPTQAGPPPSQYTSYAPAPPPQQQYVSQPVTPQYNYGQPPQSYATPSSYSQYGRPQYPTPGPQYPVPAGPPHSGSQGYPVSQQNYGPHNGATHQGPQSNYPPNSSFSVNHHSQQNSLPALYPASQWNDVHSTPHQNIAHPQPGNSDYPNNYSGPPIQQSHRQQSYQSLTRHQSTDYGSKENSKNQQNRQTPLTPTSKYITGSQAPAQALQQPLIKVESKSVSIASSLNAADKSPIVDNVKAENVVEPLEEPREMVPKEQDEKPEEGEIGPEDDAEEAFQWDYAHAFEETEPKETVALAQPLSASFKSTPVPLIQAWSVKVPSISRYARKDNVAEFVRTIRSSPQWSYLQEDPAFEDGELDGELIPFDDVPAWMATRHRMISMEGSEAEAEADWDHSRKRSRDEEEGEQDWAETAEQGNISHQTPQEDSEADGPRNKRQKQEISNEVKDEVMEEARSIGTPGTMIVIPNSRGGTPCLANSLDDAWAPQPGERATSPPNPVEALLASLGVSGDAKPVKQNEPSTTYMAGGEESSSRNASQTPVGSQPSTSFAPVNMQQNLGPKSNQAYAISTGTSSNQSQPIGNDNSMHSQPTNGPQLNNAYVVPNAAQSQYGPPVNTGYGSGPPAQHTYQNGPQMDAAYPSNNYVPLTNGAYGAGPQAQSHYTQPGYGHPINTQYTNGPQNNFPQGPYQHGPARNPSFGNAPPMNSQQGYVQFGPPTSYANGPSQNNSYPNPHYAPSGNQYYGNGPAVNYQPVPQYGPPQNQQFGNTQQQPISYGINTQMSPAHYGPQQVQHYPPNGGYQIQPSANGSGPQYGNGQQGNFQYPTGPPAHTLFNNGSNSDGPVRQDSGYFSARGSYSNGPGQNEFNNHNGSAPHIQQGPHETSQPASGSNDRGAPSHQIQNQFSQELTENNPNITASDPQVKTGTALISEQSVRQDVTSDNIEDAVETNGDGKKKRVKKESDLALSDLEKELLGELDPTPTRRNPLRKVATKKPQPVVEAAYGRRW